jgi:hypothetical protein
LRACLVERSVKEIMIDGGTDRIPGASTVRMSFTRQLEAISPRRSFARKGFGIEISSVILEASAIL